jgi:hypothetical protein
LHVKYIQRQTQHQGHHYVQKNLSCQVGKLRLSKQANGEKNREIWEQMEEIYKRYFPNKSETLEMYSWLSPGNQFSTDITVG